MRFVILLTLLTFDVEGFPPFFPPLPPPPPFAISQPRASQQRFLNTVATPAPRRQGGPSLGSCPSLQQRLHSKTLLKPCCDGVIKTVVEGGMKALDLFGSNGPQTLGPLLQELHKFVQDHFKKAFEIIMAPKDFHLKTNYNGSRMCKFESNNYFLAVYETPGHYDINSPREAFFSKFATNDKLRLPKILSKIQQHLPNQLPRQLPRQFPPFGK